LRVVTVTGFARARRGVEASVKVFGRRHRRMTLALTAATVLLTAAVVVGTVVVGRSDDPSPAAAPTSDPSTMPCDPGGGFPRPKAGCPDSDPETGWLDRTPRGGLRLKPFHTLGNDAEGRAYAQDHDLEFPFSNDYFDAPVGTAQPIVLDGETVCTGIIRVGSRGPLADHAVDCGTLAAAAGDPPDLPVAVWRDGATIVQVSELYRP
jgi:hypothetical protein